MQPITPSMLETESDWNEQSQPSDFFDDEREDDEEGLAPLTEPFDPRRIDITSEAQNVQYLIDLLEDEHVDLNTEFQRSSDLWSAVKKSRLIESLMVRLPIPPLYFSAGDKIPADRNSPFQVVDGLQRLSALRHFVIDKSLRLKGLSFLSDLEGLSFNELDRRYQRALLRAQVAVYTIRPGTPKDVTYVLFERLNTGGLTLNPQEIRHALNQGRPAKYLTELASVPSFVAAAHLNDGRMKDRELVLRYVSFRMTPPTEYRKPLKGFLDKSMEMIALQSEVSLIKWKTEFTQALDTIDELLGTYAFSKNVRGRPQMNKALFDAWIVCLAELSDEERKLLISVKELLSSEYRRLLSDEDSRLSIAVTSRTSDADAVRTRFGEIARIVTEALTRARS